MKYLTKAGVKFIKESRTGRQYPRRGRRYRRSKAASTESTESEETLPPGVVRAEPGSGGIGSNLPPGVLNPKPKPRVKLQKR